jgi:hypothetical protein
MHEEKTENRATAVSPADSAAAGIKENITFLSPCKPYGETV